MVEEDYENGKYSKAGDFFIGVGIFFAVGIVLSMLTYPMLIAGRYLFGAGFIFTALLAAASIVIPFLIYKKYFPERKFIKIGMIVSLVISILIPLVLLGACFLAFSQMEF